MIIQYFEPCSAVCTLRVTKLEILMLGTVKTASGDGHCGQRCGKLRLQKTNTRDAPRHLANVTSLIQHTVHLPQGQHCSDTTAPDGLGRYVRHRGRWQGVELGLDDSTAVDNGSGTGWGSCVACAGGGTNARISTSPFRLDHPLMARAGIFISTARLTRTLSGGTS